MVTNHQENLGTIKDNELKKVQKEIAGIEVNNDTFLLDLNKYPGLRNEIDGNLSLIMRDLKDSEKQIKILGFETNNKINDIGTDKIGEFIGFEATIKQIPANPELLTVAMIMQCNCRKTKRINTDFFDMPKLPICTECGNPMNDVIKKIYLDMKLIEVEEPVEEYVEANRQPLTLKCLIKGDIARGDPVMNPGDRIKVYGVLRIHEFKTARKTKETYVLDVLGIENIDKNLYNIKLSSEEIEKNKKLNKEYDMFNVLKTSIMPDLIGFEEVKEGILCQMFSHTIKNEKRGQIHVLLIGDPGVSKSQILLRIRELNPKSYYTVGGATTTGGLIGIVNRDEYTGRWIPEAGLITKTHQGLLCIDEVDKLHPESLGKLNQALEQQKATITKAGLNVTYPAETTVLAAMNPVKGYLDRYEGSVHDQIRIPASFMDRFDLIFVMQDQNNPETDKKIIESIIGSNKIKNPLKDKDIIKYVAYAKQEFEDPVITPEVLNEITSYYLKLRSIEEPDRIPGPRVIEAITRLTKSIARIYLRDITTLEDVKKAIKIYDSSLDSFHIKTRSNKNIDTLESMEVY